MSLLTLANALKVLVHSNVTTKTLPLSLTPLDHGQMLEDLCDLLGTVNLQQVLNNGNKVDRMGGNTSLARFVADGSDPLGEYDCLIHEDGVAVYYGGFKIADFGHDPAVVAGESYLKLFTPAGVQTIEINQTGDIRSIGTTYKSLHTGDVYNITKVAGGAPQVVFGIRAINKPTVAIYNPAGTFAVDTIVDAALAANYTASLPVKTGAQTYAMMSDVAAASNFTYLLATDASFVVPGTHMFIELPLITAARTITLPAPTAGAELNFSNLNPGPDNWDFLGTVHDNAGIVVTGIPDLTNMRLIANGTVWRKQ